MPKLLNVGTVHTPCTLGNIALYTMGKLKFERHRRLSEGAMTAPTGSDADGLDAPSSQLPRSGAAAAKEWREEPLPAL